MTFGEYMVYLLNAPLKKRKGTNQLVLFFYVIGKLFDQTKEDIFRVRRETNITTASDIMLQVHGRDRDMIQLQGESLQGYRQRLLMKAAIAKMAGTNAGILYALRSLGYADCQITPVWEKYPERWAEFYVHFQVDLDTGTYLDRQIIWDTVRKTKEASAKPNYVFHYSTASKVFCGAGCYKKKQVMASVWIPVMETTIELGTRIYKKKEIQTEVAM